MQNDALDKVLNCPKLPSLPTVAIQLLEITRRPNMMFSDIEEVVQHDPALTGRILKIVNSSYYALSAPCPTIGRALKYLGLNTVKSLVLGFSLVDASRGDTGVDLAAYWKRCLFGAAASRRIADLAGVCDKDEAFIAALMQDIGMLAMSRALGAGYAAIAAAAGSNHGRLAGAEHEALGFDHADAGAALGDRWRLPPQLIAAICHHHRPDRCDPEHAAFASIVALAGRLHGCSLDSTTPIESDPIAEQLGLSVEQLREVCEATVSDARELADQFTVPLDGSPKASEIMAEAEEAMLAHTVTMQRQAELLEAQNRALSEQAYTDGLTGVGNRKRFDETLEQQFAEAAAGGGSVGLILGDADRFKSFNDTYGHQAGDAVLVEIGRRLTAGTDEAGVVCRYGGEEFAVIVPGADRRQTAQLAEELRERIAATEFELGGLASADAVPVTASFGAAVVEPETAGVIRTPELLIKAADRALYAAKEGGRNCVRVFKLRQPAAA